MPEFTIRTQRGNPRRTKMVCTIGPATLQPGVMDQLIGLGMNVARINCSHGSADDFARLTAAVRESAERVGRMVAILFDLSGPKMRLRELDGGLLKLVKGETVTFIRGDGVGTKAGLTTTYPALIDDLRLRDPVFLDDGNLRLRVKSKTADTVACEVEVGGDLLPRKGINLPGSIVSAPSLTEKDRADVRAAVTLGADYLALSFVRTADHVDELRALLKAMGSDAQIVSKIEKPQALDQLDAIVRASDAVMVARGDLGVEMPVEQVPAIQKRVVAAARRQLRPVIVATQMLESMIHSPRPTRAEVSDIHNAIEDGCDAVMLSAETASGQYPVEAAAMMTEVCHSAEKSLFEIKGVADTPPGQADDDVRQTMCEAATLIAHTIGAKFIVVRTETGETLRHLSAQRRQTPIVAMHPDRRVLMRQALTWGVIPVLTAGGEDWEAGQQPSPHLAGRGALAAAASLARELQMLARELFHHRLATPSDKVVIIGSYPWGKHLPPNSIRCIEVGDALDL